VENRGRESKYVTVLFALPLVVQLAGLVVLYFRPREPEDRPIRVFYNLYLITMILCVSFYCPLWLIYNQAQPALLEAKTLCSLSLFFILCLLSIVLIVNFAIMMPVRVGESLKEPSSEFWQSIVSLLEAMKKGVLQIPFWALLHFLTVFLSVSYLFGFAFAFHDRAVELTELSPYPPLYWEKLPAYKMTEESFKNLTAGENLCFNLYFENDDQAVLNYASGVELERHLRTGVIKPGSREEEIARLQKDNYEQINAIIKLLDKLSSKVHLIQLTVIGHANDKQPTPSAKYPTNFALSDARAKSVQDAIDRLFRKRNEYKFTCNLLWFARGISNEPLPYSDDFKEQDCDVEINDDKMVRVTVTPIISSSSLDMAAASKPPFQRLRLLDFISFAITPGGSNNTILTSTYAKFLESLVSICHLFFFVGFFNALLSLKDDRREHP
jgi:hypothetical protein